MAAGVVEFGKSYVFVEAGLGEQIEDVDLVHEGRDEGVEDEALEHCLTVPFVRAGEDVLLVFEGVLSSDHEEVNRVG